MGMRSLFLRNTATLLRVLGLAAVLGSALPAAADLTAYPRAPLNPTSEDCQNLYRSFLQLAQQLNEERSQCSDQHSNPVHIDYGDECLPVAPYRVRHTLRAYPECGPFDVRICELAAREKEEVELCRSRIQQPEEPGGKKVLDTLAKVDQLYGKYEDTVAFIRNPKAYLKQALQGKFSGLYRELFPSLYGGGQDDLTGISAMYTYAHQFAEKGIGASPDPLVGRIQKEAFDLLATQHQRTLAKLGQLEHEIARFGADLGPQSQKEKPGSSALGQEGARIKQILVGRWQATNVKTTYQGAIGYLDYTGVFRADGSMCWTHHGSCTNPADFGPWALSQQMHVRWSSGSGICEAEELTPEHMSVRCYGFRDGYSDEELREAIDKLETLDVTRLVSDDNKAVILRRQ